MTWAQALLLAVVQGLTEFLPVSSSGHLAALQNYLTGFREADLAYDVLLHVGTLVAVLIHYRRDLLRMALSFGRRGPESAAARRLVWMVALGTLPAAAGYFFLGDWIEASFRSLIVIAGGFLVTGTILYATRRRGERGRSEAGMGYRDALAVGAAQCVALLPGVSRSGSTIAAALAVGLERELAVRYSFLLSIPAILGGSVVKAPQISSAEGHLGMWLTGALVAAAVAYGSIHILLRAVRGGHLMPFAIYCWLLGASILAHQVIG